MSQVTGHTQNHTHQWILNAQWQQWPWGEDTARSDFLSLSSNAAEIKKQREFYQKLGMEVPGDIKGELCNMKTHLDQRNGTVQLTDAPLTGFINISWTGFVWGSFITQLSY